MDFNINNNNNNNGNGNGNSNGNNDDGQIKRKNRRGRGRDRRRNRNTGRKVVMINKLVDDNDDDENDDDDSSEDSHNEILEDNSNIDFKIISLKEELLDKDDYLKLDNELLNHLYKFIYALKSLNIKNFDTNSILSNLTYLCNYLKMDIKNKKSNDDSTTTIKDDDKSPFVVIILKKIFVID